MQRFFTGFDTSNSHIWNRTSHISNRSSDVANPTSSVSNHTSEVTNHVDIFSLDSLPQMIM